ncbi:hypothetical protein E7744_07030 [Citricoccus sp. SGAir0253]|uniref:hypothetical protein n=1 Tax=Citricoccus sp. SGAir0253 TaxID=2567881 RepID=UPI0010CD0AB8|nr:hypothetical protein [Citricoccus sp. SGAir0253]QCU77965.1 hypothetical protein E7744_07030 [Citricoccus sp. SGAir0253]
MSQRDRDDQAGIRTLLVPHLLARGHREEDIASMTQVPLALVNLIAEEPERDRRTLSAERTPAPHGQPTGISHRITKRHLIALAILASATITTITLQVPFLPIGLFIAGIVFYWRETAPSRSRP